MLHDAFWGFVCLNGLGCYAATIHISKWIKIPVYYIRKEDDGT